MRSRLSLAAGLLAASTMALQTGAQTIYPLNRADILTGARFDSEVELPGMAVGVITNTEIEGATPAGMVAHTRRRADINDIVGIYPTMVTPLLSAGTRITVAGRLDLGSWLDPDTEFVSQLRLVNASYRSA